MLSSGLLLEEGLGGGQAERMADRIGVDPAVVVWLDVVLRGTGRVAEADLAWIA
jgi:hypothetical protein